MKMAVSIDWTRSPLGFIHAREPPKGLIPVLRFPGKRLKVDYTIAASGHCVIGSALSNNLGSLLVLLYPFYTSPSSKVFQQNFEGICYPGISRVLGSLLIVY